MKSKLKLKKQPALQDYQNYVQALVEERGFVKTTVPQLFMLLMEECGELAKSIRKTSKDMMNADSKKMNMHHEAADVFIYLLDICNRLGIDLEKAFRDKEEINKNRIWK